MLAVYRPGMVSLVLSVLLATACGPSKSDEATTTTDSAVPASPTEPTIMPDPAPANLPPELAAARERHSFRWLGLTEEAAAEQAAAAGIPWRVAKRDGQDLPLTRDRIPGRLNAHLQDGVVVAVSEEREGAPSGLIEGVSDMVFLPFIGHNSAASQAAADAAGRPWRVVERDGEGLMMTMDYLPERVNVVLVDDIVVAASGG